jgi:hypothetical protein
MPVPVSVAPVSVPAFVPVPVSEWSRFPSACLSRFRGSPSRRPASQSHGRSCFRDRRRATRTAANATMWIASIAAPPANRRMRNPPKPAKSAGRPIKPNIVGTAANDKAATSAQAMVVATSERNATAIAIPPTQSQYDKSLNPGRPNNSSTAIQIKPPAAASAQQATRLAESARTLAWRQRAIRTVRVKA